MAQKVLERKGFVSAWMAAGLAIAPGMGCWLWAASKSLAKPTPDTPHPTLIVVNSNEDDPVQADNQLTLREAIEIANGTLPFEELSEAEKANISLSDSPAETETPGEITIAFDLAPEQTEIKLVELLPPLSKPGLTIDGTTQPFGALGMGHGALGREQGTKRLREQGSLTHPISPAPHLPCPPASSDSQCPMPNAQFPIPNSPFPIPVVSITAVAPVEKDVNRGELVGGIGREAAIAEANSGAPRRGLTIMADRVTIRGLMLYGFRDSPAQMLRQSDSSANILTNTPAADILIVGEDWLEVGDNGETAPPPKDILIENNWLGIGPVEERQRGQGRQGRQGDKGDTRLHPTPYTLHPTPYTLPRSGFGIFVYNGSNVTVRQNQIAYHDGSGIITSVRSDNLQIEDNIIFANGLSGMSDAIRLEGNTANSRVTGNVISENDGAGIFLFKPSGSVLIEDNEIANNGRRLRRAAVYLMGSGHEVRNNQIIGQPGPGVVVSADGQNRRNFIQGNRFERLEGLSIDLNTRLNQGVSHYQIGDGPNPQRDTGNRRKGTGNGAINAPVFLAREFYIMEDGKVRIDGIADPGSTVEIYRVSSNSGNSNHGPLTEPIATVETDAQGRFGIVGQMVKSPLRESPLREGDRISAIATHPDYGTSEPARNAEIRELEF
ncbi:MAG: right-handed parallel beta-helix repeat-containing protein [Oscillatoria sp. SIO1A7]|nr:right-handed parallel beta-helix repeat-containing protein [Oscillatoria sp. SIO1A7]